MNNVGLDRHTSALTSGPHGASHRRSWCVSSSGKAELVAECVDASALAVCEQRRGKQTSAANNNISCSVSIKYSMSRRLDTKISGLA